MGWPGLPSLCAQAGWQAVRVMLQGEQDPPRNQTALVDASRSTVTYYVTSRSNRSAVVLYDSQNVSVPEQGKSNLPLLPVPLCPQYHAAPGGTLGMSSHSLPGMLPVLSEAQPRRLLHRGETRQGQGGMPTAGLSRGRAACSNRARFSSQGYVCYRPAEQHACYLRRMEPGDRESTRVTLSTAELRVSDGHGRGVPGGKRGAALTALCRGAAFWAMLLLAVLLQFLLGAGLWESLGARRQLLNLRACLL